MYEDTTFSRVILIQDHRAIFSTNKEREYIWLDSDVGVTVVII